MEMKKVLVLSVGMVSLLLTSCGDNGVKGYVNEFKYKVTDFDSSYTPNEGPVSVMVVPLSFRNCTNTSGSSFDNWDDTTVERINNLYFGETPDEGWFTFKDYYEAASFGKISIHGQVAPVYDVGPSVDFTAMKSGSYGSLYSIFRSALKKIQNDQQETDWSAYDRNNDKCFDAIHFISDFRGAQWMDLLWPHMSQCGQYGDGTFIGANTYSLSSLEHTSNAVTAIHEQGHMFGLQDYYDYDYKYDFLGSADMQVANIFDWNSFSKSMTGWSKPYIVTGEKKKTRITLNAASIDGSCLIVPANYEYYNGTPFDEYFMFELFSPQNLCNARSWSSYEKGYNSPLGEYGIRAYHVNGSIYSWGSGGNIKVLKEPDGSNQFGFCCNNNDPNGEYQYSPSGFNKYPLINIISREDSKKQMVEKATKLNEKDLWKQGDTFTFEKAKCGLVKDGKRCSLMNNSLTFNYEIKFEKVSAESMTVLITKVATK